MQIILSRSFTYIIIFHQFCENIGVVRTSNECDSNVSVPFPANNGRENLPIQSNMSSDKERSRSKRTAKPATQFFDELLGKRLFNTTMNFIVPGAKINLPRHTEEGSVDHLAMQAFFGIFWAAAWLAFIAIPVSQTYFQPLGIGRSLEDDANGLHFEWKLDKEVAEAIGLDWEACIQKSVCQAHEFPEKYGVLGKTVQILFPADDKLDDTHTTFQEAAVNGAIGQDCRHIYKCFFDMLDVILYVKDYCFVTLSN